jgi:hypothetical protein
MGDQQNLDVLLQQWQQSGRHAVLEQLIHTAEPVASCVIERVLRRRGIRDPQAVDDALLLVQLALQLRVGRLRDRGSPPSS